MKQAVVSKFSHVKPGDMEYLEIVSPADFTTVDVPPAVDKCRRTPGSDRHVVPRGINLCRRPLAAADCCGAGCGAPPRIADDI